MTVKIKSILVSQPQPESEKSPYAELAEKNNVRIDFRPFVQIEGLSAREFRQSRIDILEHTAIVFGSKTAVDHFYRLCEDLRLLVPDTMKYFCLSESVAYYLQKYIVYRKRKIFFGKSNILDLMDVILKHKDEKYLLPVSEDHKSNIPETLDKHKISYSKAIMYRSICNNLSDLSSLNYDILVFYSPSGIRSLLKNFPEFKQNEIKIASFGAETAKAVKEAGLRLDIQAPAPELPSMTMALDHFIKEYNKLNGKK
jgi:uroporphyrinogen-III synthase